MKKFILNMLSYGSSISSKRVITLLAFLLLALAFILDMFLDIKVSDKLVDVMEMLVVAGFGSTVLEKFSNGKESKEV